jgi:hypothetical protein
MDRQTISTSLAPEVILEEVAGDLQVKGWEEAEVQVRGSQEEVTVEEQDDVIRISSRGDLTLRVPSGALIQIGQAHGDARLKLLEDAISIDQVFGSLTLRNVGVTKITRVHGDLFARQVVGDLDIEQVNGNANVRDVQSNCRLCCINGNLDLSEVHGAVEVQADGNARVRLKQTTGSSYRIQVEGNVQVELPADANLAVKIDCEGEMIRVHMPGNSQTYRQDQLELTFGDGSVPMEISASGVVSISEYVESQEQPRGFDDNFEPFIGLPDDFAERISQQVESQIEAQMEAMTRSLNDQFSRMSEIFDRNGIKEEEAERIMEEARAKSERATAQAEEKLRRSQEKIERKMETHRRKAEAQAQAAERRAHASSRRGWTFQWSGAPFTPPAPNKPPATEEERLLILRMLEQKKVTLEQATQLLEALEGKGT